MIESSPLLVGANEALKGGGELSLRDAKARIPRNVVSNWASYAVNILVIFLISPFIVHRLGNTVYGVWALIGQVIEYSFLLDFGIRIAATRFVAHHLALREPHEINRVVSSGLVLSSISAVLSLACGAVVAWALPQVFVIPPELVLHARLSVLVLALGIAASFPGSLFTGCVVADSRYELLGIRKAAPGVLRALLLWFFLERGYGLLTVALVSTLTVLVGYALDFVFTLRLYPWLRVDRESVDRNTVRSLINFSIYAFVISVAFRVIFMTDNLVVGAVLGPVAVTFYAVGMNLAGTLRDTLGNITFLYAPLAYQMQALDRKDSLRQLFISGSRIAMIYVLPGVLGLVILGPRFLGFWMGSSFADKSGPVLILLAIEVGFYALTSALGQVLYATQRHKANAWLSLGNAAANLTLSVILVRWSGAVGVAWGTVIPAFLVEAVILPVYTASLLQVSVLRFYKLAVLQPILATAPYGLWLWFCAREGIVTGYGSLALVVTLGLIVYALLAWNFSLDSEERALARQWADRFKSALSAIGPAWGGVTPG